MENPWFVSDLDEFLQYCCPECDEKYPSKEPFVLHAFEMHPNAKDCLELRLDSEKVEVICKKQIDQNSPLKFQEIKMEEVVIATDENNILETSQNFKPQMNNIYLNSSDWESEFKPQIVQKLCLGQTIQLESQDRFALNQLKVTKKTSRGQKNRGTKSNISLKCEFCGLTFSSGEESKMNQHMAIVHQGVAKPSGELNRKSCDICEETFPNLSNLQIHVKEAHKDCPELKCDICNLTFVKIVRKMEHMNVVHEGVKNYPCNECGKVFGWMSNLKNHVNEEHSVIPDNVVVQDGHVVVKVSQGKVPQKRNTDEPIKCTICQPGKITNETIIYATKDDLRLHMRENPEVHKKRYCELCDKFILWGLNEHKKVVHGPKTKVECNYCGKYVANKHILKEHIDAVHKGIKLSCPYCKKKIARKNDLRIHINAIHKGIRVDCNICGAKLYKKQHLVRHLKRFHDIEVLSRDLQVDQTNQVGSKPIVIKGKAKRQVQVTKSKLSVKLKNKREFNCEYCGKSFQNSTTKTTHIDRVHGRNLD